MVYFFPGTLEIEVDQYHSNYSLQHFQGRFLAEVNYFEEVIDLKKVLMIRNCFY